MFFGRPNTIKTQESLFSRWIEPEMINPEKFTERELRHLIEKWESEGLMPHTVQSLTSLTKKYIQWRTGHPMKLHSKIKIDISQKKPQALTQPQARNLLDYLKKNTTKNIYTACMIAYHTGSRKGEVFGLTRRDIDFCNKCVTISKSYEGPTKSGKSRTIPMAPQLEKWLLSLKSDNLNGPIVKPFNPGPILAKACNNLGIPKITFHGFRHTFATLALQSCSVKEVQDMLGHSNASTTINIYWQNLNNNMKVDFT